MLSSVLYFRSGIREVSEDLSEADRMEKPGGLGESNRRGNNTVSPPVPCRQILDL